MKIEEAKEIILQRLAKQGVVPKNIQWEVGYSCEAKCDYVAMIFDEGE